MKLNGKYHYSISIRIFIILISIVLLQAGLLYWQSSLTLEKQIINEDIEDVKRLLISQQQILKYLAEQNSHTQIQQTITGLAVDTHLKQALLIDNTQKIIAATRLSIKGKYLTDVLPEKLHQDTAAHFQTLLKTFKNKLWFSEDGMFLYAISPIKLGKLSKTSIRSDKVGFLYVHYDLNQPKKAAKQQLLASFIPELIMLLLTGLGLSWYFQQSIGKRIHQLKTAAQDLARFDYTHRISIKGEDEISDLSESFNTMADEIQKHH